MPKAKKKQSSEEKIDKFLQRYYYDPKKPGSFGGLKRLYAAVQQSSKIKITKAQVNNWLKKQDTHTLHRGVKHKFPRLRVITGMRDSNWDADLIDMSKSKYASVNDNVKYILVAIDILSRYAFVEPLKSKSGPSVAQGLQKIFDKGRQPLTLRTDGNDFSSKTVQDLLKKNSIYHYVTNDLPKAAMAEAFNRYFKLKLFKYMTATQNPRYIDVLPSLIDSYNSTPHTATGIAPKDVNEHNEEEVWDRLYLTPAVYAAAFDKALHKTSKLKKHKRRFRFSIGDTVRVSYLREKFARGYDHNWSGEVFKIAAREYRQSIPVYRLQDMTNHDISGLFYSAELQRVTYDEKGEHKIEKVLATRVKNGVKQSYVKYLNWPAKFNQWIDSSTIRSLIPKQTSQNNATKTKKRKI